KGRRTTSTEQRSPGRCRPTSSRRLITRLEAGSQRCQSTTRAPRRTRMADTQSLIPQVVEEDVEWICSVMGLREFDQSRQDFLRKTTTLDVSACPGSGKTTLIVAKLAIMARKWPHRTKGVCVLSHTNAAREQIQRRLRGTV